MLSSRRRVSWQAMPIGVVPPVELADQRQLLDQAPVLVEELGSAVAGMEERLVGLVDRVVHHLQPVGRLVVGGPAGGLAQTDRKGRVLGEVVEGKRRRTVGRPEIGEQQPLVLAHRIGALAQLADIGVVVRLGRGFEDAAVGVEQPAVVAAADAALLDAAELERGAAVRAVLLQEPDAPAEVAERDQILAQQAHGEGQVAEIVGMQERVPEAAQILAAGRAGADPHEAVVARRRHRLMVGAVGFGQEALRSGHREPDCVGRDGGDQAVRGRNSAFSSDIRRSSMSGSRSEKERKPNRP